MTCEHKDSYGPTVVDGMCMLCQADPQKPEAAQPAKVGHEHASSGQAGVTYMGKNAEEANARLRAVREEVASTKSLGRVAYSAFFADIPDAATAWAGAGDECQSEWGRAAAAVASVVAARADGRVQALTESLHAVRDALGAGDLEMAHEAAARVVRERDEARSALAVATEDRDDWKEEYERVVRERGEQYEARKRAESERDEARKELAAAESRDFADLMREVEAEALANGPAAVAELKRLRALWTKRAKAAKKASKR